MVRAGKWNSIFGLLLLLFVFACQPEVKTKKAVEAKPSKPTVVRPDFNADSAYAFIEKQVAFGPRVPNTDPHRATKNYLVNKLKSYGLEVVEQDAKVKAFDGKTLNITNIVASHLPEKNNRILLMAHWDTRPFADQDSKDKNKAIDGANDGASGVGVLLEIARQLQIEQPNYGVDILLFDGEDYGQPAGGLQARKEKTWCLGSQYWGANPHRSDYTANFGILLDMVGAKNAFFTKEAISRYYAPEILDKVWNMGKNLGHGKYFVFQETTHVGEDDHLYVNKLRKIPSIDIVQYDPKTRGFGAHWHTHDDNLSIIDKQTLKAVGETVLATVFSESN